MLKEGEIEKKIFEKNAYAYSFDIEKRLIIFDATGETYSLESSDLVRFAKDYKSICQVVPRCFETK
jgi:hypothetical protein